MRFNPFRRDRRSGVVRSVAAAGVLVVGAGLLTVVATRADAAAGCRVTYSANSWSTGFTGNVTITNLGDQLSNWTLEWDFAGNQQITQSWNSEFAQSGAHATLKNAAWNGSLPTNGSANPGFNGTYSGTNTSPTAFKLNGVACTGTPTQTTPAASPTKPNSPSASPVTSPSASKSASPSVSPSKSTSPSPSSPPSTDSWNPPSKYVGPLAANWKHQEDTYSNLYGFKNYLWDQVFAAQGSINYCVRWESNATVSASLRDQIESNLARQFQKWVDQLQENGHGWMGFPYKTVPVKVVGWAVRDRNQLQWTDTSRDIYVNNIREGAPQCGEPCGRFFHQDGNYSGCPGGASHHYDMSLWLTSGFSGGAGGDWGQRISSEYYTQLLGSENIHILLHEMGHSWGLNDFYDYDPLPSEGFVMKAGSASMITEFDKWMLRDFWRHLKSRYGL
jgi:hypothetical protein